MVVQQKHPLDPMTCRAGGGWEGRSEHSQPPASAKGNLRFFS